MKKLKMSSKYTADRRKECEAVLDDKKHKLSIKSGSNPTFLFVSPRAAITYYRILVYHNLIM